MSLQESASRLLKLGPAGLARVVLGRLCSVDHIYVLRYNLRRLPTEDARRVGGGELRLLNEADMACLKAELDQGAFASEDAHHVLTRLMFFEKGSRNCYGVREGNRILYTQWLVLAEENEMLMRNYGRRYLPLRKGEAMIENAFTHPVARGRGYYSAFSLELMRLAAEKGAGSAVTYVKKGNLPSLTQLIALGFQATALVRDYRILGGAWISRPAKW